MEHSIIFPLPLSFHIGFVLISVILLILCYKKRRYAYELYMLIGIVSTLLVYIDESKLFFYLLGLEEVILFIMTVADMVKVSKANAAAEKAAENAVVAAPAEMPEISAEPSDEGSDSADDDFTE